MTREYIHINLCYVNMTIDKILPGGYDNFTKYTIYRVMQQK